MRKTFAAFLLVLALLFGGVCYAGASVYRERDQARFTETALYGDPAMVEGVTVEYFVQNDSRLVWDIRYTAGSPEAEVDYGFSPFGLLLPGRWEEGGVTLDIHNHTDTIHAADVPIEESGLGAAYRELYEEASPGEEVSRIIRLGDYYEFYSLNAFCDFPGVLEFRGSMEQEKNRMFEEFFRIPVLPDEVLEIHLEKSRDGTHAYSFGSSSVAGEDWFQFITYSAIGEDACYFTFRPVSRDGVIMDTGHIPGGYGIYRLPFGEEEIYPERLETVYPLDPAVRVDRLDLGPTGEELLLFAGEDGANFLTVIDLATMEETQRIRIIDSEHAEIPASGGPEDAVPYFDVWSAELHDAYLGEDFMILRYLDFYLALLSRDGTGEYTLEFITDVRSEALPSHQPGVFRQGADWDGERLVLCTRAFNPLGSTALADVMLSVYDETGLLYAGEYHCSLNTGWNPEDWGYACQYIDAIPFRVRWPV